MTLKCYNWYKFSYARKYVGKSKAEKSKGEITMNARRVSKRIIAVVLTMMMVIGCFTVSFVANAGSEGTIEFVVHYSRADGDYSKSDVYSWTDASGGQEAKFDSTGTAILEVPVAALEIGFIIRQVAGDWGTKDPDGDRKFSISDVVGGTVEVSAVSGAALNDFTVDTSKAIKGLKLTAASVSDDLKTVTVQMGMAPTDEEKASMESGDLKVVFAPTSSFAEASGTAAVSKEIVVDGTTATITFDEPLPKYSRYKVQFGLSSTTIKMPDFYSTKEFEDAYTYTGNDLGATYTKAATSFRVWAPTAVTMHLNVYESGTVKEDDLPTVYRMLPSDNGTWVVTVEEDLNGKYYTYTASFEGGVIDRDIVDPYAKSVGVNGLRGLIFDLDSTDPEGWNADTRKTYASVNDMAIYEVSVRDFSSDPDSGITNKGKYLAFTETGTKTEGGAATGIDHLKELGITSVHLLPTYDFGWSEEISNDYNWGYDPVNYNSPEGSYSTDPYNGAVRVNEYKQMVKALHDAGIGVIMDAVYNHTYSTDYCYNRLVPGYYHRPGQNTSGCGNDVASERNMVSKFITDSVKYWIDEYHLDGVRFDLMGIIDADTMNQIRKDADTISPEILLYGEGWDMGSKSTKEGYKMATYKNAASLPGIAFFSDTIRDGIKGSVFDSEVPGYINGAKNSSKVVDGVTYTKSWSPSPSQIINYQSCHDNLTVWDKLIASTPEDTSFENRVKMNKLGAAIVFTAQGIPFMMGGEEFLRTKGGHKDSVRAGDEVNMLDYSMITDYSDVNDYYKGLIAMRKAYPQFRMTTAEAVNNSIEFSLNGTKKEDMGYAIAYRIKSADGDMLVYYNPVSDLEVELPEGNWGVIADGTKAGTEIMREVSGKITIPGISALVLVEKKAEQTSEPEQSQTESKPESKPDESKPESKTDESKIEQSSQDQSKTESQTSENSQNNGSASDLPATGDATTVFVFIMLAAAGIVVALMVFRRRSANK